MITMNVKELADYLNVSQTIIRKLVREKKIPYFKVGTRILFYEEDIISFIRNQYKNLDLEINDIVV